MFGRGRSIWLRSMSSACGVRGRESRLARIGRHHHLAQLGRQESGRARRSSRRIRTCEGERHQSGRPSRPATEMSSSMSGQWIPVPGPISRQ